MGGFFITVSQKQCFQLILTALIIELAFEQFDPFIVISGVFFLARSKKASLYRGKA